MIVGKWVGYTEDGLVENWKNGSFLFTTKKEIISQLAASFLDNRKRKTVRRRSKGQYVYDIPDCDCQTVMHTVYVEKITKQNLDKIKEMVGDV